MGTRLIYRSAPRERGHYYAVSQLKSADRQRFKQGRHSKFLKGATLKDYRLLKQLVSNGPKMIGMEVLQTVADCCTAGRMHALHWTGPTDRLPVVLVHGLGMSSRYMVRAGQRLRAHAQVWAPDLPGFGRSERPRSVLSVSQLASALANWCEAVGLGPAVLSVTHSAAKWRWN